MKPRTDVMFLMVFIITACWNVDFIFGTSSFEELQNDLSSSGHFRYEVPQFATEAYNIFSQLDAVNTESTMKFYRPLNTGDRLHLMFNITPSSMFDGNGVNDIQLVLNSQDIVVYTGKENHQLASQHVGQWTMYDIKDLVRENARVSQSIFHARLSNSDNATTAQDPLLVIYKNVNYPTLELAINSRKKRSDFPNDEREVIPEDDDDRNECRLLPWIVSFHDLGWQNVIAPPSIRANLCVGACNSNANFSNHALLRSAYRKTHNTVTLIPDATCTPMEYRGFPVLYFDHDEVVVMKTYHDLQVTRCGCQ